MKLFISKKMNVKNVKKDIFCFVVGDKLFSLRHILEVSKKRFSEEDYKEIEDYAKAVAKIFN